MSSTRLKQLGSSRMAMGGQMVASGAALVVTIGHRAALAMPFGTERNTGLILASP